MDQETKKRFDALPKSVQDFMNSNVVPEKLSAIGEKNGLHIDQIGILQEETASVILGLAKPEEFVDVIESRANLSSEKAISIAADINIQILIPVRNLITGATPAPIAKPEVVSMNRNDILSAIENPTPVEHPISIAQEKPVEKTRPSSGDDVAHQFVGEKLAAPVTLPSQKIVVPAEPKKPSSSVDPYREPIS